MDIEKLKKQAIQNKKENQKFLDLIKKKKPKNLDEMSLETHQEVFDQIDCLSCANCCKTTGPLYTEKDIERIAKFLKMKPKNFEEKFLKIDEDNDKVLKNLPCTFLAEDNTCIIYEVRPKACREYPHTDRKKIYQINHLTIQNTLICPATQLWIEKMKTKI